MTQSTKGTGGEVPDARQLTRLGRFLLCLSLDELPELVNLLRGDMSLVEARPLLMECLDRDKHNGARRATSMGHVERVTPPMGVPADGGCSRCPIRGMIRSS